MRLTQDEYTAEMVKSFYNNEKVSKRYYILWKKCVMYYMIESLKYVLSAF